MRDDIPILHGAGDDTYGTQVWLGRVSVLATHLRILRQYIPDGRMGDWLKKQCDAGIAEAEAFMADAKPSDSMDDQQ